MQVRKVSAADCVFCRIAAGAIPAKIVYRGEHVLAIEDVNPQAPSHLLVMPVAHAANLAQFLACADGERVRELFATATRLGYELGANGFRIVVNTGAQGGQTVDHLHVHVLAGRAMHWPPG